MTQAIEDTRRKQERIQRQESALLGGGSKEFAEPHITMLMRFGGAGAGVEGKGEKGRH